MIMKTTYLKVKNTAIGYGLGGNTNLYIACKGDKFGYLPNEDKPYMPLGGKKTLKSVESILIFK